MYTALVVENGTITLYKSKEKARIEKEVNRAKEKGFPVAVVVEKDDTTV